MYPLRLVCRIRANVRNRGMQQKHYQAAQAGLGILSFVAAMTIKELSELQFWALVTAGAALVTYAIFGFLFSRQGEIKFIWLPMMKLHPSRDNLFPFRRALLIKDAAQIAYDKTHNTGLGITAQRWAVDRPTGDELSTYAHYFKDLEGYTLYGKRPPSNVYQVIPTSRMSSLWFTDTLNGLKHAGAQEKAQYTDVAVTRADLKRFIKEAKELDHETAQTVARTTTKDQLSKGLETKTRASTPDLELQPSGGRTVGTGKKLILSVEITNVGISAEISAKIGPPYGYLSTGSNRSIFHSPAPAVWNGKQSSTIKMHTGARENIVVGIIDGESRTIDVPHFDDEGKQSSWKITGFPIGEQFTFVMRLEFTADPSLAVSPFKKKVSFDITVQGNGQVTMLTDPSKVQDA